MRLRKECEHGRWEEHTFLRPGGNPESSIAYWDCPGGEFLPEGALVIEKVDGEWPDAITYKVAEVVEELLSNFPSIGNLILGEEFGVILLDALASQVGESE